MQCFEKRGPHESIVISKDPLLSNNTIDIPEPKETTETRLTKHLSSRTQQILLPGMKIFIIPLLQNIGIYFRSGCERHTMQEKCSVTFLIAFIAITDVNVLECYVPSYTRVIQEILQTPP